MTSDSEKIAIQGELGSNSELAAREFFHDDTVHIVPCTSFAELFEAVRGGRASYGMAPVENSLAGSICEVWDLLVSCPLPVVGELSLRINHCLIGHAETRLDDIRHIYSHQQALAQCREFLSSLPAARQHEVYDTAGAVAMVKQNEKPDETAIAPRQAAIDWDMFVVAPDIEDSRENYTRFLVLARGPSRAARSAMKTTVVVTLPSSGNELAKILSLLTSAGRQLYKVESRKRLGEPWAYDAYLEFAGFVGESAVDDAVDEMAKLAGGVTVVGSYPVGRSAQARLHPRGRR